MSRGDRAGEALADSPCYPARPRRLCRSSADGGRAGDSCPGQRPPRRPSAWLGAWLDAEPASHSPRVQAGEEAEEQQQLRGHAAAELGARGPRPRAGRHFLRNAVLALAASDAADCGATPAPSRRGRTGVGSGCQPRPPTASGSARGSAGRTRDTRPPRRATPPSARAPLRVRAAGWRDRVGASVPWPRSRRPGAAQPTPSPAASQCPRGGLRARWVLRAVSAAARSEVGAARRLFAAAPPRRSRRGGVSPITRLTTR